MQKIRLIAGLLGLIAVGLGAFGAHALKEQLATRGMSDVWQTAVLYHLVHAVAIFAACIVPAAPRLRIAAWLWIMGTVLFSGSLYLLALGGPKWLGPITPLGGFALILGWAWVSWSAWRREVP